MSLIKAGDVLSFDKYYSVPKEVINMLSSDVVNIKSNDIVVYMLLLDRLKLSLSNHERFSNDDGEVYVVYEQKELMAITGLSNRGLIDSLKRLSEAGLIKIERQGKMLPNLYFFYDLFSEKGVTLQNLTHDFTNSHTSYNNNIYNNISKRYITLTSDDNKGSQVRFMEMYNDMYRLHKQKEHPAIEYSQLQELHNKLDALIDRYQLTDTDLHDIIELHFNELPSDNDGKIQYLLSGNDTQSVFIRHLNVLGIV